MLTHWSYIFLPLSHRYITWYSTQHNNYNGKCLVRLCTHLRHNIHRPWPHGQDMGCTSGLLQWKLIKINRECSVSAISETKVLGVVFIGIIHLANSHWQNSVTPIEGLVLCVIVLSYSHGSFVDNWRLYVFYAFWKHVIVDCSDGLVEERCNSGALATELVFLALTHRYVFSIQALNDWPDWHILISIQPLWTKWTYLASIKVLSVNKELNYA